MIHGIDSNLSVIQLQPGVTNRMSNQDNKNDTFSHLGRPFQEKILQALLMDRQWASQINEVINIDFFDYAYLKLLAHNYLGYYSKYKEFPSFEILSTIIKDDYRNEKDALVRDQILEFLKKTARNENLGDLGYVKEKTLEFCRKQGLKIALHQSVDLINTDKYETITDVLKKALAKGIAHSPGLDIAEDIDARYSLTYRNTIPTGIPELDQRTILNGGSGAGELNVVIAPTGVGKSHFLIHIGAQALIRGKNVLHYTFELRERAVGIRYDSHVTNIDSLDCFEHKEEIKQYYGSNAATLGRLRIKEYATGSATANTIRAHVEKLSMEGLRPDMLIIDYAGIMRSSERYDLPRMELKKIYEELRELAIELNVPVWTACQSNKDGADSDIVGLSNMAEAYAQAHICDFVVGLGRKEAQKATGYGSLFVAKNRAGIDGVVYKVHLNTARSQIRVLLEGEVDKMNMDEEIESEEGKNRIRRTFSEIQKKKLTGQNIKVSKL